MESSSFKHYSCNRQYLQLYLPQCSLKIVVDGEDSVRKARTTSKALTEKYQQKLQTHQVFLKEGKQNIDPYLVYLVLRNTKRCWQ